MYFERLHDLKRIRLGRGEDEHGHYDGNGLDDGHGRAPSLGRCLAPGYVTDATGCLVKDPNLRVQEAIALVFSRFEALGSVRQTHRWCHEKRLKLPVN